MLLVRDRHDSASLALRQNRRWHRGLARLLASSLDQRLAAGRPPEAGLLLASRAEALTAPEHRRALARLWEQRIEEAGRRSGAGPRAGALCFDRIARAEPAIREVVALLSGALPSPARGVAMVNVLLTDGAGPLYNPHSDEDLSAALRRAAAQLDPSCTFGAAGWDRGPATRGEFGPDPTDRLGPGRRAMPN